MLFMLMDKRKFIGAILGGVLFVGVILALTYAFYIWKGDNTLVTFNINDSYFYCESGVESNIDGLYPVLDYRDGGYQTFVVNNVGRQDTTFSLTMEITAIDEVLLSESFKYKLVVDTTGGNNNCADTSNSNCVEVGSGNFANAKVGANTLVSSISLPNNSRYQYYLFLYIDGNMKNDTAMQSSSMTSTLDVCEVVVFLNYNGGSGNKEFLKVTSTYAGLPTTVTRDNSVVIYNTNGGNAISSDSVSYTFGGWYFEEDFTTRVIESTAVTSTVNHTLYAKWTASKSITLPTPTWTGHTFEGWYSDSECTKKVGNAGDTYNPSQSITLYAKWISNTYNVTFDVNSGNTWTSSTCTGTGISFVSSSSSCTKPVTYGSTYGTMPTPTRTGYTFLGWYTSAGGGTKVESTTQVSITAAQTLYAHWTAKTYKVTFNVNSGNIWTSSTCTGTGISLNSSTCSKSVTYGSTYGTMPTPTRTGYTFSGWYTASSGGTKIESTTTVSITAAQTLYAHWTAKTYTVTFDVNNGDAWSSSTCTGTDISLNSSTCSKSVTYGSTYGTMPTPTRTGYTFDGWYTSASGGTKVESTTTVSITAAQTLYAHWTDSEKPVATITSTSNLGTTSQTATLKCTDNVGVVGYYWNTSAPTESSTYTSVTSTTSYSTTKTVNAAGTYYLACKDAAGNVSTTVNKIYYSYIAKNMLVNVTGTEGAYNTSNYAASTGSKCTDSSPCIAPNGTSLTLSSIYTVPTGATSSTFKGVSVGSPSTTAASVSTSAPTLNANTTYGLWFNRASYTVTVKAGTGGTNKVTSQNNSTGVTAASGGSTSLTGVRYGEKITSTATAATGYTFSKFSGLSTSTTSPVTLTVTASGTITANFVDQTKPVATIDTTATLKATSQTATLKCTDGVGVVGYYWDTSAPTESSNYTSVTSTTSYSTTKTVSSAGTYYLACKDAAGNVSTTVNKVYHTYVVNNMLLNVMGTAGTYTTVNYTAASSSTYLAPNGTILTLANVYTAPLSSEISFKGVSTGNPSTTAATVSTTAPTLSSNSTYTMWFDRNHYTLTINPNGGNYNSTTATTSITRTYEDYYTLLTPTLTNYSFSGWTLSGSGTLMRGVGTGTATTVNGFTQTSKTENGQTFTNYSSSSSQTSNTWYYIKYPNYSITAGHTYQITFYMRVNTLTNASLNLRHACVSNDYSSTGRVASTVSSATHHWVKYTLTRTYDSTTIASSNGNTNVTVNPLFEIYTSNLVDVDAVIDFDIRDVVIKDTTDNSYKYTQNYIYQFGSGSGTVTANFVDTTKPVATITSTDSLAQTSQTATLKCTDSVGVVSYYWGTSAPTTSSTYTSVTSTTSYSTTKTVNAAGTYYLACKDAAGNVSTTVNKVYNTYVIKNMLVNVTGTEGTYNTSNYTASSTSSTYLAPNGTTLTLSSLYTVPTGASSSTFKGVSVGAPSTTAASVSTTAPTLNGNNTYGMWFNRTTYTITVKANTGGGNKVTSQRNSTGVTASSGGSASLTGVRYGETITATATASSGYTFSSWSGLSTSTTNPVTLTVKAAGTITASFADKTAPIITEVAADSSLKQTSLNFSFSCTDGVGVVSYYWGTSAPTTSSTYTSVTSTTSLSVSKTVSAAGTYYFACKDAAGNVSETDSQTYYSYVVKNMLLNTSGTAGTYNTSNYTESSSYTYIAPKGTTLTLASIYTVPSGASSSSFKGISTGSPSTTATTVSTTAPTLSSNTTYGLWFDRASYTVTFNVNNGNTWTSSTCTGTGMIFTSSSSSCTKSVTNGSTYGTLPTPIRTGYTFKGWYTASSGGTKVTVRSTASITANQNLYAHWTDAKIVAAVSLYSGPTKTEYKQTEAEVDTSGIQLKLTYESGNTEIIDGTNYVTATTDMASTYSSNVRFTITVKYDSFTISITTYKVDWYGKFGTASFYYYYDNGNRYTSADGDATLHNVYLPYQTDATIYKYFTFGDDGLQFRGWRLVGGNWYYYVVRRVTNSDAMASQASEDNYLMPNKFVGGTMVTSQWVKIYYASNGKWYWYYFGEDGVMTQGWLKLNNTWYYFKEDGVTTTGWNGPVGSMVCYSTGTEADETGSNTVTISGSSTSSWNGTYTFNGSGACTSSNCS